MERWAKLDHYIVDATDNAATNAKWTSTTVQNYIVPANKRWFLFGGVVTLDVSSTLTVDLDDGTNVLINLATYGAGTGEQPYPEAANVGNIVMPIPLDAGDRVTITCGTAQGVGAKATCFVYEIHV